MKLVNIVSLTNDIRPCKIKHMEILKGVRCRDFILVLEESSSAIGTSGAVMRCQV